MLDINLFREDKGGNPELVRVSQTKRGDEPALVDKCVELDIEWRKAIFNLDDANKQVSVANKAVAVKKKAKEDATKEIAVVKEKQVKVASCKALEIEKKEELEKTLKQFGNLCHESVPVSMNEDDNEVVSTWGDVSLAPNTGLHHHELMVMLDIVDFDRGVKVAGHRGFFLKGYGVMLNQALIQFGLASLMAKKYTPLQPPFFMKKDIMGETAQLSEFDEALYKISGSVEDDDKYMIATSEQPISAYHRGDWIDEKSLPIRYAGLSTCFRKEAGSHGRDTWGIFRIHQFEKIEQFCITHYEKSWEMLDEMITTAEEYYKKLELPYRVVNVVSGELNNAAAKKYDLEAWFPGYGTYRELVSCSNCTDFQSRNMEVRFRSGGKEKGANKKYVHMLNATMCATERTMCCIVENYQTSEGLRIPTALQPFMGGIEFIPFVNKKPKFSKA